MSDKKWRTWEVLGLLFVLAAGNLLHFVYDWTGQSPVVGALAAVNESVWEHMKLLTTPWVLWSIAELVAVGRSGLPVTAARAAGLLAGMETVGRIGQANLARREGRLAKQCAEGLEALGYRVFRGQPQAGTVSFQGGFDCEEGAQRLAGMGIAVRAGLHCAPLAHESAGTVDTGTIRVSFGWNSTEGDCRAFLRAAEILRRFDG